MLFELLSYCCDWLVAVSLGLVGLARVFCCLQLTHLLGNTDNPGLKQNNNHGYIMITSPFVPSEKESLARAQCFVVPVVGFLFAYFNRSKVMTALGGCEIEGVGKRLGDFGNNLS